MPWRIVVCVVIAKTAWDTLGLLAGDIAYRGPSYDVLRSLPPVGGMRVRGVVLGLLLVGLFVAARRLACRGDGRMLRLCLTGVAVWYMTWSAGIACAWLYHSQILGWSAPASVLVVAALALRAARTTPAVGREVSSTPATGSWR